MIDVSTTSTNMAIASKTASGRFMRGLVARAHHAILSLMSSWPFTLDG